MSNHLFKTLDCQMEKFLVETKLIN